VSDLSDLVEPLKREVAIPGAANFKAAFPETTDDDLTGTISDALCEAQLDGFLGGVILDVDNAVTTPALSQAAGALLVLYAGGRIVRNQIRNLATHTRYEASGAIYERDQSATMLKEVLSELDTRKDKLIQLLRQRIGTPVFMRDGYMIRATAFYAYELSGYNELAEPWGNDPYSASPSYWSTEQVIEQLPTASTGP
jgi:hypothetical protein